MTKKQINNERNRKKSMVAIGETFQYVITNALNVSRTYYSGFIVAKWLDNLCWIKRVGKRGLFLSISSFPGLTISVEGKVVVAEMNSPAEKKIDDCVTNAATPPCGKCISSQRYTINRLSFNYRFHDFSFSFRHSKNATWLPFPPLDGQYLPYLKLTKLDGFLNEMSSYLSK